MLRHHRAVGSEIPARLLYSARTQGDLIYRTELEEYETTFTLTREHDPAWTGHTGRVDSDLIAELAWPPADRPRVYVCGLTGFVEGSRGCAPSRSGTSRPLSGRSGSWLIATEFLDLATRSRAT
jgi:NAD(P)H-flavin reductase